MISKRLIHIKKVFNKYNSMPLDYLSLDSEIQIKISKELKGLFLCLSEFISKRPDLFKHQRYIEHRNAKLKIAKNKVDSAYFYKKSKTGYTFELEKQVVDDWINFEKIFPKYNLVEELKQFHQFMQRKVSTNEITMDLQSLDKISNLNLNPKLLSNYSFKVTNLPANKEKLLSLALTEGFILNFPCSQRLPHSTINQMLTLLPAYLEGDKETLINQMVELHLNKENFSETKYLKESLNPYFEYKDPSLFKIFSQSFKVSRKFKVKLPSQYVQFVNILLNYYLNFKDKELFKHKLERIIVESIKTHRLDSSFKSHLQIPDYAEHFYDTVHKDLAVDYKDQVKTCEKRTLLFLDSIILFITACFMILLAFFTTTLGPLFLNLSIIAWICMFISVFSLSIIAKRLVFEEFDQFFSS